MTTELRVRTLLEHYFNAVRSGDIDAIMSHYAQDVIAFDALAALQFKGTEAYRRHWEACMAMCPGQMIYEVHEVQVEASETIAFCHFISRCGATMENGEEKSGWMRATVCLRQRPDGWKIVHEHYSSPFDPVTGKVIDSNP